MDKTNHDNKIQELLNTGTYAKLRKDPTPAIERRLNQKLLALHEKDILSKPLYFKLRSSSATCPILFGQPKIHKPTIQLRPIVSTRGSPTYNTAQHLATILQPLVGQSCHHVINSRHFIEKINNINISPTVFLVSFDVESLFTNVPVTEACDIIKTRLQQDTTLDTRTALSPEQIHDLLLTCLNETSFQWRDG